MKKTILSLTTISILFISACNNKKEVTEREMVFLKDSIYRSSMNSDTAAIVQDVPVEEINKPTAYRKPVTQKTRRNENNGNSSNQSNQTIPPPVVLNPAPIPVPDPVPASVPQTTTTDDKDKRSTAGTGTTEKNGTEETNTKKEGISKAAKGAIIGGVGGAVVGAVITKKGKGAVVGGILGAAGGYILGRKKDKADGRVSNLASL